MFIVGSPAQSSFLKAFGEGLGLPSPSLTVEPSRAGRNHHGPARCGVVCHATKQFEAVALRTRKRRRGARNGGDSSDDGEDDIFGSGGWGGSGGWYCGGNGGSGGNHWGSGGYSEGAFHFQKALYECLWFWQLLCAASLLQALHFMVVGEHKKGSTSVPVTSSVTMSASGSSRRRSASN